MKEMLYAIVGWIARVHDRIQSLNDAYEYNFSDKQLHFLVIGLIGMAMVLVLHPLVKWLADRGHTLVITWFYVMTVLIVLVFAIEIGQGITHTGTMDFGDIVSGLEGFIVLFAIYAAARGIIVGIHTLIHGKKRRRRR